eukprot:366575-Chlamydomonas_euryale.AAC.13
MERFEGHLHSPWPPAPPLSNAALRSGMGAGSSGLGNVCAPPKPHAHGVSDAAMHHRGWGWGVGAVRTG